MEEDFSYYYNKVEGLTAVCRKNKDVFRGDYLGLEIGKEYHVSHISVRKSSSYVLLEEFGIDQEYNTTLFDFCLNGVQQKKGFYTLNDDYLAPYLRARKTEAKMKKENIPAHLKEIEEKHHVRVLLAVESGSRAWGFESLDSDWDLRFVYVHEPEYYFRIKDQRDVIEYVYDDDCDAVGWELKKALRLFAKCNMSLLEWINSPIVYFQDKEFVERIKGIQEKCFNPIGAMYHYNSIYNKINEVYLDDAEAPLKKFLYYLRGIFACDCIYNKRMMPPVNFYTLLGKCDIEDKIRTEISKLLSIKKHNKESDISNVNKELTAFAKERAEFYNNAISTYRPEDQREDVYSELDKLAFDMICKIC